MDGKKVFSLVNNSLLTFIILLGLGLAVIVFFTSGKSPLGNVKDDHGCISSAGYTWSYAKGKCVRVFEEATELLKTGSKDADELSAFIVFDDNKTKGDVFLPGPIKFLINKDNSTNTKEYTKWVDNKSEYSLVLKGRKLALFKGNQEIYFRMYSTEIDNKTE